MKNSSILFQILFCFIGYFGIGQSIDLFTVSQSYAPNADFTWINGEKQKAIEHNTLVNLKLPAILSEKLIWYTNITYSINELKANEIKSSSSAVYRLQGLIVQSGLVIKLNEKTRLQALLAPRILGENLNFNNNSLQFGAAAMIERIHSKKLTMRYGLLYNEDKFGPMFVPLIYTDWKFGNGFFLKGLWPIYGKLGKQINPNLQMGISEFALITSYSLNKQAPQTYMQRSSIDLAYFIRQRIYNNWHIEPRIGISLSRGYEQYNNDDKLDAKISMIDIENNPRSLLNGELSSAPFINFRLIYVLPTD